MNNYSDVPLGFDASLKIGDLIEIRWTNSHNEYCSNARVTKINGKTLRASILEEQRRFGTTAYPVGFEIIAPRFGHSGHTHANGVWPASSHAVQCYNRTIMTDTPFRIIRAWSYAEAEQFASKIMAHQNPLIAIVELPQGEVPVGLLVSHRERRKLARFLARRED